MNNNQKQILNGAKAKIDSLVIFFNTLELICKEDGEVSLFKSDPKRIKDSLIDIIDLIDFSLQDKIVRPETSKYYEVIPEYGHSMTVEDYISNVESGSFIDYDGHGHPCKDSLTADILIKPSDYNSNIPLDATHIVWFNR